MARRLRLVVAATAAALLAAGCSTTSYAPPQRGMVLTWKRTVTGPDGRAKSDTFDHQVERVSGDDTIYHLAHLRENPTGDQVWLYRGIFSYAYWRPGRGWVEYRFNRADARRFWPLSVGKSVSFGAEFGFGVGSDEQMARANWHATEKGTITWTVLRRETVTVPAGTFQTIVIKREYLFRGLKGTSEIRHVRTGWYAPSLGWIVKQTVSTVRRAGPGAPARPSPGLTLVLLKVTRPAR